MDLVEILNPDDQRWSEPVCGDWVSKFCDRFSKFIPFDKKPEFAKQKSPFLWSKYYLVLNRDGKLFFFKMRKRKRPPFVLASNIPKKNPSGVLNLKDCVFWKSNLKRNSIQISCSDNEGDDDNPFIFRCETQGKMLKWIHIFGNFGKYDVGRVVQEYEPKCSLLNVSKWGEEEVKEYLSIVPLGSNPNECLSEYEGCFENTSGKKLVELSSDQELKNLGIKKLTHRRFFLKSLKQLKHTNKFDYGYHVVLKKILAMMYSRGIRYSPDHQRRIARNLSDPTLLSKTYLSLENELQSSMFLGRQQQEEEQEGEEEEQRIDLGLDNDGVKNMGEMKERFKIKLVITEIVHTKTKQQMRRILSPIISRLPLAQEFGLFHAAIAIGPFYFEWTNSSLVIPRRLTSSTALISIDLEEIIEGEGIQNQSREEIIRKVSEVVCLWNTRKSYHNVNPKRKPHLGNCQQFCDDLVSVLGVSIRSGNSGIENDEEDAIIKFLERMKRRGHCEIGFHSSKRFRKVFNLPNSETCIKFEKHEELDLFVEGIMKEDKKMFMEQFRSEYRLLRSFDQAFWMRHNKFPVDGRYLPLRGQDGACSCPFKV